MLKGESLTWRPSHRSATEQVEMKMEDALPRQRTVVEHGTIAAGDVPIRGDFRCDQVEVADQRDVVLGRVIQRADVLTGDDQNVCGGLRIDILEGHRNVVLVNDASRNPSLQDLAEQAVGHVGHGLDYSLSLLVNLY